MEDKIASGNVDQRFDELRWKMTRVEEEKEEKVGRLEEGERRGRSQRKEPSRK